MQAMRKKIEEDMKLVYCPDCKDIKRLLFEKRGCRCGKSGGYYLPDGLNVVLLGEAIPLGIDNYSFAHARENREKKGLRKQLQFTAFFIPEQCATIVEDTLPEEKHKYYTDEHYHKLLNKAIKLAVEGHAGQLDKIGKPYILHPLTVMGKVETMQQKIVAVLHDYLEDTKGTVENLKEIGCDFDLIYSIECITHLPNEPNIKYYERILSDPTDVARVVKLADLEHNSSPTRMQGLPQADQDRMAKKYDGAKRVLEANKDRQT
jgi:hypothetical protein